MKYKKLFSIELVHDYFDSAFFHKNENNAIVAFKATEACDRILKGIGARVKVWKNTLYIIIPTSDEVHPHIQIPDESAFEFYWEACDLRFFSYTQLPVHPQHMYFCSNTSSALRDGKKYLHAFHPAHDPASTYTLGHFCDDGAGNCLEALANLGVNSNPNNTSEWAKRGKVTYLSPHHQLMMPGSVFTLRVNPSQNIITVKIFGWNHASNSADRLLKTSHVQFDDAMDRIQIDMRGYASGRYRVEVNGVVHEIYLDSTGELVQATGVITIYHNAQIPGDYTLLTNAEEFKSPAFTIRLAPLSTIWHYRVRTDKAQKIEDRQTMTVFDAVPGGFTSQLPIRLVQTPHQEMVLFYGANLASAVEIKPIPLPVPGNFSKLNMNNTDFPMSTISLNY